MGPYIAYAHQLSQHFIKRRQPPGRRIISFPLPSILHTRAYSRQGKILLLRTFFQKRHEKIDLSGRIYSTRHMKRAHSAFSIRIGFDGKADGRNALCAAKSRRFGSAPSSFASPFYGSPPGRRSLPMNGVPYQIASFGCSGGFPYGWKPSFNNGCVMSKETRRPRPLAVRAAHRRPA